MHTVSTLPIYKCFLVIFFFLSAQLCWGDYMIQLEFDFILFLFPKNVDVFMRVLFLLLIYSHINLCHRAY